MWFWILLIVLVVLLLGSTPTWPHSREWGYGPSGGFGVVIALLLILLLFGMFDVPGCRVDAPTPVAPAPEIDID